MRSPPVPAAPRGRSTGRKRPVVNYTEHGTQDMCTDSDFEPVLKLPQPLDNKSYPSASHIAIQREIDNKKANKMVKIQPALIT